MIGLFAGRRILVVEDEMLVLMNIEMALEDLGCIETFPAASVAEALAVLTGQRFDAAILDVNLVGERSYPVADALAQLDIPFAFSTGYSDHGDRLDLRSRPVLRKPYVRSALVAVLEQMLADRPFSAAAGV